MSSHSGGKNKVMLAEIVGYIGIDGARWVEENLDEQYKALVFLWNNTGDIEAFMKLVAMNSIVSYQLSGRGEDWWWEFSRWFSQNPPEDILRDYLQFLMESQYNRRLLGVKEKRVIRLWEGIGELDLLLYYKDILSFWNIIARSLHSPPNSKTVVFTVKMIGYAGRIVTGEFLPYPMEIPIPLDSRILSITRSLTEERPIDFWNDVARVSGVPPLHIDSLLWVLRGVGEDGRSAFLNRFGNAGRMLMEVIG